MKSIAIFLVFFILLIGCKNQKKSTIDNTVDSGNNTTKSEYQKENIETSNTNNSTEYNNSTIDNNGNSNNTGETNSGWQTENTKVENTTTISQEQNKHTNTNSNSSASTNANTKKEIKQTIPKNTSQNTASQNSVDNKEIAKKLQDEADSIRRISQSLSSAHPTKVVSSFDFNRHLSFLVQQNAQDDRGYNVLMLACERGYSHIVATALEMRSDGSFVNKQSTDGGKTALMIAANQGTPDIVKMLLLHGANREITRDNGKKAIDFAKNSEIIEMLKSLQRY